MKQTIRPRRSVLYMPGSNARALEKARELPADCLILDLEDAVAPDAKAAARDQVVEALQGGGYGNRELVVRVNDPNSELGETDIDAVGAAGADAILLPKVETAETISIAGDTLNSAGAPPALPIWIMAETALGILHLDNIVAHQPRLAAIVMGTSDLAKQLRVSPHGSRAGLVHALSQAVLAARAHGLDIIDGVHLALDDADGFRDACKQGRELGFDGKSLIHPRQIATANECFGISEADAESAREILAAWETASQAGSGITVVRGQLIEQLHVDEAQRVLTIFEATAGLNEK
ncbi:MAG: CoA ester lyase [Chromatiales bacterium]|jgi:citrate lyase subunit beta/citryl-CoA lyase|nr:CoA ester lyase [Chromatiales bacterium]MDP6151202.1 CoA ester lyase [Gammaproteobacteria bacterium]MDP7271207.1 CoA ester lyase [Gammaproteobacteria bacterium]HJP05003.1 CoA ester lyase [Gammaproteobacteria bacterium]